MKTQVKPLILIFIAFLCTGGTPTEPTPVLLPLGWWSGQTALEVQAKDVTLFLGCGGANFPRPTLDSDGTFQASGYLFLLDHLLLPIGRDHQQHSRAMFLVPHSRSR